MNILFYCSEYPPYITGGIGSATKIVAEELARRGHNVYVVGYYVSMPTKEVLYENINMVHVYRLNKGYRNSAIKQKLFGILSKLGKTNFIIQKEVSYIDEFIQYIIDTKNIDVIEITDYFSQCLCAKENLTFKKFSIPCILRIHGCASFLNSLKGIHKKYVQENDQRHFSRCNHISSVSQYSLDYILKNFDCKHFNLKEVIYNPIDKSFLQRNPENDNNTILFIGKIIETKGCYSLLKAFNNISLRYPDWKLRLIGNGNIQEAKSLIHPDVIEKVTFLGYCNREKIKQEIDNCSFACIPTYFENFSMVSLEVMAREKALVYTERTSGKEIIEDNCNGFLVNPENINEIEEKCNCLIADVQKRKEFAEKAYFTIKNNFLVETITDQLEDLYKKAIYLSKH